MAEQKKTGAMVMQTGQCQSAPLSGLPIPFLKAQEGHDTHLSA
jgi:hypothetical protein